MSWVTVIWSISAGACLTLAFLQFIVWCKDRRMAMNAGASAFFIKGVESGEFLAGIKAAAESTN